MDFEGFNETTVVTHREPRDYLLLAEIITILMGDEARALCLDDADDLTTLIRLFAEAALDE